MKNKTRVNFQVESVCALKTALNSFSIVWSSSADCPSQVLTPNIQERKQRKAPNFWSERRKNNPQNIHKKNKATSVWALFK